MEQFSIGPIGGADRQIWELLWRGYLDFYDKRISEETIDFTWKRLTQSHEIHGFLATDAGGKGVGLAHYLFYPATSSIGANCYMPDLFVSASARRLGVGRQLIAAVVGAARQKQAAVVYWQTEEFNGTARRLYERVAKRSPFIRYNVEL